MPRRFIQDLMPGESISDQVFRIASKDLRTTTNGSLYIHAVLADKTGQLLARIWQASEEQYNMIPLGGYLRFKGRTENYKGNLQFIVDGITAIKTDEVDVSDFLPTTDKDVEQMWDRVKSILRTIKDPDLLLLIKHYVSDEKIINGFKRAPAAMTMHHAYLGGLLDHTLNLLELALVVIPRYPQLDLDLVLSGVFLHDIGKTTELKYDSNIEYSDEGQLLGHIIHSVIWVEEKVKAVEHETGKPFPPEKKWMLQHIVLAHHGQYEFGSPKLPATPEAVAVHYLDNLDAKVQQTLDAIQNDKDLESNWTGYIRSLETKVYKGMRTSLSDLDGSCKNR